MYICTTEKVNAALRQVIRKPWEPFLEVIEIEIHTIIILFFAPLLPFGVLAVLGARLVETYTNVHGPTVAPWNHSPNGSLPPHPHTQKRKEEECVCKNAPK